VAGSLNECSFTNYNPALQQSLEIFGASAGGNELYIHAPKSSRYRHILRFGFMTADVMSLNVNDGSCQCEGSYLQASDTYPTCLETGSAGRQRDLINYAESGG